MSSAPAPNYKVSKPKKAGDRWTSTPPKGSSDLPGAYEIAPGELPVCCGETPKEVDRFDPNWNNGKTRDCSKCKTRWCCCVP